MAVTELCIPRETVSDESVVLAQWYVDCGQEVQADAVVASVEASKAVFDIEAGTSGYIFYLHEPGDEIKVGDTLAVIADTADFDYVSYFETQRTTQQSGTSLKKTELEDVRFSRGARRLIEEHGLDVGLFAGKGLVTEEDVAQALQDNQAPSDAGAVLPTRGDRVIIVGGGGHAKMCIDVIRQQQVLQIAGILDDGIEEGEEILGVAVLGPLTRLEELREQGIAFAINGIGAVTNHPFRSEVFERIKNAGFALPNIVHPNATVEPSAMLGEGNQIMAGAIVGSAVEIGDNCIINSGSVVSHDSVLGSNVHVAPGALLAGGVTVGDDTLIGMGATVFLGVNIGARVVVVNGQHVFNDVKSNRVVGGEPRERRALDAT